MQCSQILRGARLGGREGVGEEEQESGEGYSKKLFEGKKFERKYHHS